MLGRKKYLKTNIEDRLLAEVASEMKAGKTFESVYVGVNLELLYIYFFPSKILIISANPGCSHNLLR